jgi:hypothetical protein
MWCRNGVRWLYKLEQNFTWDSNQSIPEDLVFLDKSGAVRLIIEKSGRITVTRGYAWNGCSPKLCILDLLLGTPEGVVHAATGRPKTYYASLVHDALYQFLPDGLPLRRHHADAFFLRLLAESYFAPRWVYWAAVRLFGGLVRRGTRLKRKTRGTRQRVGDLLPTGNERSATAGAA